jgi:transposase
MMVAHSFACSPKVEQFQNSIPTAPDLYVPGSHPCQRRKCRPPGTRIMNQLQAAALNEGLRYKKKLWREAGRQQLESLPLAPWASRRRHDLLDLDRINPTITELTHAIELEAKKCPEAQRLMTHPGVGALTDLAFVLILGDAERFGCGKQIASYLGLILRQLWAHR